MSTTMHSIAVVLIKMLILVFAHSCCAFPRDTTIPQEAINAWQSMANEVSTVQFTIRYKNRTERIENLYSCSIQGSLKKCEIVQTDKGDKSEKVLIENTRGFVLGKGSSGKWRVMSINDPGVPIGQLSNSHYLAKAGFSLHGSSSLLEVPNNERFKVENWQPLGDSRELIESKIRDNMLHATITLTLQPEKRFRVVAWSATDDESPEIARGIFEYADDSVFGEVVPIRQIAREGDLTWELISLTHKTLPEEEFNLSFYGLPDYVEPPASSNYWIWIFLVAVVVTLVVFWKTRRAT
ncbi:hypothetical protein SH449x_004230 [Pirellulaceae bacterium SH449]